MKPNRKISNPRGVGSSKRIALSLLPDERAKIERIARKTGASMSNTARALVLQGLEENPAVLQSNIKAKAA